MAVTLRMSGYLKHILDTNIVSLVPKATLSPTIPVFGPCAYGNKADTKLNRSQC